MDIHGKQSRLKPQRKNIIDVDERDAGGPGSEKEDVMVTSEQCAG